MYSLLWDVVGKEGSAWHEILEAPCSSESVSLKKC